jgi:hypothetical protein
VAGGDVARSSSCHSDFSDIISLLLVGGGWYQIFILARGLDTEIF